MLNRTDFTPDCAKDQVGALTCPYPGIDVWVCPVDRGDRRGMDHLVGDVAVHVQRHAYRHVRADDGAHT